MESLLVLACYLFPFLISLLLPPSLSGILGVAASSLEDVESLMEFILSYTEISSCSSSIVPLYSSFPCWSILDTLYLSLFLWISMYYLSKAKCKNSSRFSSLDSFSRGTGSRSTQASFASFALGAST